MVLKATVRHVVAQSVEEVVIAKVMRAEEFLGLLRKIHVVIEHILRSFERFGGVSCNVHFLSGILSQPHNSVVLTRGHGRIDEHGQRNRQKLDFIAILRCDWQ